MNFSNLQLPEFDINEKYQLLAKIGSGGMGDVFLAIQRGAVDFSRLVVIKRIHDRQIQHTEAYARMFINEARVVGSLNHPHIVKVYDFCMTGPSVCIVMEYVEGETLKYILSKCGKENQTIPLPLVNRLILDACDTLQYAHNATTASGETYCIVHRDIGLHNLMLDSNGYLKIIDFGIAKSSIQTDMTTPGLIKGNPGYMAPDVFNNPDPDHRVDIYALGLCYYELVTRTRAYKFDAQASVGEIIRRINQTTLELPSTIVPDLPSEMDDVVMKAVEKDRTKRYQTVEAFSTDLKRVIGQNLMTGAEVKQWFIANFGQRIAQRRAFGAKMLDIAKNRAPENRFALEFPNKIPSAIYNLNSITPSNPSKSALDPGNTQMVIEKSNFYKLVVAAGLLFMAFSAVLYFFVIRDQSPKDDIELVDNLVVNCSPSGAMLTIDGKELGLLGTDGLALRVEPNRPHEIVISKQGYRDFALPFIGPTVGSKTVNATLIEQSQPASAESVSPVDVDEKSKSDDKTKPAPSPRKPTPTRKKIWRRAPRIKASAPKKAEGVTTASSKETSRKSASTGLGDKARKIPLPDDDDDDKRRIPLVDENTAVLGN